MTSFYLTLADTLTTAMLYSCIAGVAIYGLLLAALHASKNSYSRIKHNLCYMAACFLLLTFLFPFGKLLLTPDKQEIQTSYAQYVNADNGTRIIQTQEDTVHTLAYSGIHLANDYSFLIVLFYATGLCVFAVRLMVAQYYTYILRRKQLSSADERWVNTLQIVCSKLQIEKKIRIAFSGLVSSPCIIGYAKALILIPVNLACNMSAAEIEAILLHELAHVKRYDHYLNLAMQIIKCILFFNPFMWLVMRKLDYYRELACDETAAQHNNDIALATSLVKISQLQSINSSIALSLYNNRQTLFHRIQNLLSMKDQRKNTRFQASFFAGALTFTIALLLLFTSPSLSQDNIKDQLQQVSDEMYRNGNSDFALIDAMKDGLIQEGKRYDLVYDKGKVSIDGKMLPEPQQSRYSEKMTAFYNANGSANSWSSHRGDGYYIKDILNPASKFRKNSERRHTEETTQLKKLTRDDGTDTYYQREIARELINDGIIKKDQPLSLKYNIHGVYVNGKKLEGQATEKYTKLFAEGSHIIPKQESDGVEVTMDAAETSSMSEPAPANGKQGYYYHKRVPPTPPVAPAAPVEGVTAVPAVPAIAPIAPIAHVNAPAPPAAPAAPTKSSYVPAYKYPGSPFEHEQEGYMEGIVAELLKDGIIKNTDGLRVKWSRRGVSVNHRKLKGTVGDKYVQMFKNGSGFIPKGLGSGVSIAYKD